MATTRYNQAGNLRELRKTFEGRKAIFAYVLLCRPSELEKEVLVAHLLCNPPTFH